MAPQLAQTFSRVYVVKIFVKIGKISIVRKGFRLETSYFRTLLSLHFTHHFEFGLRGTQKDTDLQRFGIKFVQNSNFVEVGQHAKEMGLETSSFFGTLPSTCLNSEDFNSTYDNEDNNRTHSYTTFGSGAYILKTDISVVNTTLLYSLHTGLGKSIRTYF